MKYLQTLITYLIASNLAIASQGNEILSPQVQFSSRSVNLELPLPSKTERQKYIVQTSEDNGFVCHNFLREEELKDKLFDLETQVATIPFLEEKLKQKEAPTALIDSSTTTNILIGFVAGMVAMFAINQKLK